jgi:glycosyltransferase involved in cell wall biosynthesis
MSEMLQQHHTGITVPHGDAAALTAAIETLLDDPHTYQTISHNMREYAQEHFDAGRGADAYENLLRTISPRQSE